MDKDKDRNRDRVTGPDYTRRKGYEQMDRTKTGRGTE